MVKYFSLQKMYVAVADPDLVVRRGGGGGGRFFLFSLPAFPHSFFFLLFLTKVRGEAPLDLSPRSIL